MNNGHTTATTTKPPGLLDQVRQHESESTAKALQTYAAILHRADSPQPDDAKTLAEVARTLGKDSAAIEADLQIIANARRLVSQLSNAEEVLLRARDLRFEMDKLQEESQAFYDRQKQREAELAPQVLTAEQAENIVISNHAKLREAIKQSNGLLSESICPPVERPARIKTEGQIKAEREQWENRQVRDPVSPIPPGGKRRA